MTALIDVADAGDLPGIMAVMDTAFSPEFGEAWTKGQCLSMLTLPGSAMFVVRAGQGICGFAFVRTVLDEAELLMIAVDPNSAGQGLGRRILRHVINYCAENGVERLHLEVREGNKVAIKLYQGDGFVAVGRRDAYYRGANGQNANSITFSKSLVS